MTTMDQIHRIRELYYGQGKSLTEIAKLMGLDWRTVRKYVDKEDFNTPPPKAAERQPSKRGQESSPEAAPYCKKSTQAPRKGSGRVQLQLPPRC